MKLFSLLSIALIVLGLLLFGLSGLIEGYFEPIILIGVISLLAGIVLSFIAFSKQEEGILKFISLISFFIVLFLITWFEPFQVVRIITWLKNFS